eukprot:jgi/Ulvmu1/4658/UM002_0389.1
MRSKAAVPVQPRSDRGPTQITMTEVSDIPGDSKFARALASSDYHVRSKGLAALYVWLQRKQSVPDMGLQKLWRGIMFCFWHSDKSHVQQQLADQLVKIMMDLSDEVALSYFQAFLQTMYREWGAIDKLRLDKFMMLVRRFIKGMFLMLQDRGWYDRDPQRLLNDLSCKAFNVVSFVTSMHNIGRVQFHISPSTGEVTFQ